MRLSTSIICIVLAIIVPQEVFSGKIEKDMEENPVIRNVNLVKEQEGYFVSGEARPGNGILYYVVEDGHHEWIKETTFPVKHQYPNWGDFSFEIRLPKNQFSDQISLTLYLYEKDRLGNLIHFYPKTIK